MNYDHTHEIHEYWRNNISQHLCNKFSVVSFDDYLKRFAYLPSGKWIQQMDGIKLSRITIAFDVQKFVEKYAKHCVTYNMSVKPEDGFQRIIYQMSPTLHVEIAYWIWMEHDIINSYGYSASFYNNYDEYIKFVDELWEIRKSGNTEDKPNHGGFSLGQSFKN